MPLDSRKNHEDAGNNMPDKIKPPLSAAWFVWGLGAMLYLMGFFQRVAPAVMTEELMRGFQINAAELGNLSALYFYSYVAMQIPTGVIADHWGPRRLLTAGALIAGSGAVLFALSTSMIWAGVGRFLIGGSVAVAFVGLLKIAANWFPPRYYAMVSGMALLTGLVGAIGAGPPLRLLMNYFPWRSLILASALATLAVCLLIWKFVRDHPHEKGYSDYIETGDSTASESGRSILAGLVEVFKYRNTILLFIIPGGAVSCVLSFSGLWGVPFLSTHYHLSTTASSVLCSILLLAWGLGGPAAGWLSDRIRNRKMLFISGTAVSLIGWIVIIYLPNLSLFQLSAVLALTGFSAGSMILSFAFAKESIPPSLSGTVSGVINMGVMSGPMIMQPLIGWMLDRKWAGELVGGVRVYNLEAYHSGFALMLAWLTLSLALLFFTRETNCRQMVQD